MAETLSRFQQRLRASIMLTLQTHALTITELAEKIDGNYYTVRNAVYDLVDAGEIKATGHARAKNIKYTINDMSGPNRSIPLIKHAGGESKLHLIANIDTDNSALLRAYQNLPRNVTRIFKAAERSAEGADVSKALTNIERSMRMDLKALQNAVSIFEQILNNHRNFDTQYLKRYINDEEYDPNLINTKYAEYFDAKEEAPTANGRG